MVEKIDHSVEIRSKSPDDNLATEHDEKEMRNKKDPRVNLPASHRTCLGKGIEKEQAVLVIVEDHLTAISTRHHMVIRPWVFNS